MIATEMKRGFTTKRFTKTKEPRVQKDDGGYYLFTLSENVKIYFDDFYQFLEGVENRCLADLGDVKNKLEETTEEQQELRSYYFARKRVNEILISTLYKFYSEAKNFGVVMTPWCFGTVVLEKVENYRDRLEKGKIDEEDLPEYPYDVIRYIDEIYKKMLLDLFQFPESAFAMRWQYSELLKRYSNALTNITSSLQSVMMLVKSYGS